jgi:opacity protein-like surface antigen
MFGASGAGALAADLDVPPLAPALGMGPRWEGFTFGAYATALWAPSQSATQTWYAPYASFTSDVPGSLNLSNSGFGAGAQVGYDKQFGSFVYGAIADYGVLGGATASSSYSGSISWLAFGPNSVPYGATYSQQLNSLGTVRGRFGYVYDNDWLIYGTAGLAFGETTVKSDISVSNGYSFSGSRTGLTVGYVLGAGVQYAMGPNWSLGLEGLAYSLGNRGNVAVANFDTFVTSGGVTYLAPSPQLDTKSDFSGFQLRLTANYTFDGQVHEPVYSPSADPNTEVPITVGMREGISLGQSQLVLYDGSGSSRLSRLTYKGSTNVTAEPYFKLEMPDWSMYVSGYAGIGQQSGGKLQDEDFPPGISPYSSTNSSLQSGSLEYGVIDVGYNPFISDWYKVGGFVGYSLENDGYNAYGCTQTATNPAVCGAGDGVGAANLTISDSFSWNAARVGLSGSVKLPMGWTLSGDAAWLPFINVSETNYHYLRMPGDFSGPLPGTGSGSMGFQMEATADYMITPNFDIGIGARYWSLAAKGHINFQDVTAGGGPQVANFSSQRMQAFVQTGYHF